MSIYDDVKATLAAVQRLTAAERTLADHVTEYRRPLGDVSRQVQELRDRQLRIELKLETLDKVVTTRAQAAAAAAAAMGVAAALAAHAERLRALERDRDEVGTSARRRRANSRRKTLTDT